SWFFPCLFSTVSLVPALHDALPILAALWHNGLIDYMAMTIAVLGISIPNFVLAVLLIQTLAVNGIFPTARWESPVHMVLPSALRSEEHTSELQSRFDLVCRLLLELK